MVRAARADEAALLTELAVRSKAYWPYPAAFVRRFAADLGLSAEVVTANDVRVGVRDGVPVGFYTLLHRGDRALLDDLWVEPSEIGNGLGRRLFAHATARAAAAGASVLRWDAEPYAVGFYERMGGSRVGWVDSPLGRRLPVMQIGLATPTVRSSSAGSDSSMTDAADRVQDGRMPTWDDVVTIGTALPGVEESASYRTPSLKVAGKSFARLRTEAEGGLVLMCDLDEKQALLACGDPAFYTTPHYDGYGAILVDLAAVDRTQLTELIEEAWRLKAPPKLRKSLDGGQADPAAAPPRAPTPSGHVERARWRVI